MNLLLDTCTFLWLVEGSTMLSRRAVELFSDPANTAWLSSASAWEISVKHALGRLPLPDPPARFVPRERKRHAIEPLPLDEEAALHLSRLPKHHKDPFDRILICQALVGGMAILTPDPLIVAYPVRALW